MIKPRALYIHIPFCNYLCHYCDFTKLEYSSFDTTNYLDALEVELKSYDIGELDTIYVGGGTPTSLATNELKRLLELIKPYQAGVKEYNFEANPDSLSIDKLKLFKEYGVNRLSIGIESTSNKILKAINRHHTFEEAVELIKLAQEVGIININVDLILGLPNVSKNMIIKDIDNLLMIPGIKHISCYSLTVSPHTVFYNKRIKAPSDDILREYYDIVTSKLEAKGFVHYEVSNYALKGYESLHNLTYWRNETYYGVGLGASGYINKLRYTNTKNLKKYLAHQFIDYKEEVSLKDEMNYQIILNLRTVEGLDLAAFKTRFNKDLLEDKKIEINELIKQKYLRLVDNILIPSYEGMMILDTIILKLIY